MLTSCVVHIAELLNADVLAHGVPMLVASAVGADADQKDDVRVLGHADLVRLGPGWRGLQSRVAAAVPFQTFEWAETAAAESCARGGQLAVVVAGPLDAPRVIWPLVIERKFCMRVARWLGEPLAQYGDVLVAPEASAADQEAAWRRVMALPVDALILRNVRETSMASRWLCSHARAVGPVEGAPYMDYARMRARGGFEQTVGPRATRRQRQAQNRLAKLGVLDFQVHEGPQARVWAEEAVALKRSWLSDRGLVGSPLEDDGWRARLIQLAAAPGGVVSALHLDGRLIAAEIGFRHKGHYVAYLGAFAPDVRTYSPGRTQMRLTIDWGAEQGLDAFDFLAPNDAYKHEWTCSVAEVRTYVSALTLRGRVCQRLLELRPRLKAAYHALPPGLRRVASKVAPL